MSKLGKIGYLICGLSLVILIVARLILGGWINYLYVPLGLGAASFLMALIVDYKFYLDVFSMRTTKHGMNMGTLILMALALVVAVNYGGKRFDKTADLTEGKLHSLSEQSEKALKDLRSNVKIRVFYKGADQKDQRQRAKESLQVYLDASPKLSIEFINSLVDVKTAKEYLKSFDQLTVVAEMDGKRVQIDEPMDEEKVTAALLKLNKTEEKTIYFLTGHGERNLDNSGPEGLSELKTALQGSAFTVEKLNLLKGDAMPKTGSVIAIVGPKTQILQNELDEIRKFAREGGSLFLGFDPGENHQGALLTKSLGIEFKNNYVFNDKVRLLGVGMAAILGMVFDPDSDITKAFAGTDNYSLFFLGSEVTRATDANSDLVIRDIVKTEGSAFAVDRIDRQATNVDRREYVLGITAQGSLQKPEGSDALTKGPEFRGAFFGDSDFTTNQILFQGVNRDLVLNTFAFLAKEDGLISIRPKRPAGTEMTLTENQRYGTIVAGVSLPLLLIILSGVLWFRRKGL